jgi:uncharacterized protein (TIGR02217 family)
MGFINVQFPPDVSRGYAAGPQLNTLVSITDSGHEERTTRWRSGRIVAKGSRDSTSAANAALILAFYRAVGGALNSWRFKEWTDYCSDPATFQTPSAITPLDQVIGTGDGVKTVFYLTKTYATSLGVGAGADVRSIQLPVAGTVRVAAAGAEMMSGWSVNTTSGAVTFSVAPNLGDTLTAGFQHDVCCRFATSMEAGAQMRVDATGVESLIALDVIEVKNESPYYCSWDPGGSYTDLALAADLSLTVSLAKVFNLSLASGANRNAYLPTPTIGMGTGGAYFVISNTSGSTGTITVRDDAAVSLVVIAAGSVKEIYLVDSGGGTRTWFSF